MPANIKEALIESTRKAADELIEAVEALPEDKRAYSPGGTARTALDMAAECAVLMGYTAEVLETKTWPDRFNDFAAYGAEHSALKGDWAQTKSRLVSALAAYTAAQAKIEDSDLNTTFSTAMGAISIGDCMFYPYWNMKYHLGQITYLSMILEPPKQ